MNVSYRLKLLINDLGLNITSFSREIGLNNNVTILRITKDGHTPSFRTTYMIKARYENLNLNWLIYNDGEMWQDKHTWEDEDEDEGSEETIMLDGIIKDQLNSIEEEE